MSELRNSIICVILLLTASASRAAAPEALPCTATGDLRIVPFASKVFPAPRNLRILLPTGYSLQENRKRSYPVLYLNDGQNLFDVCTSLFNREEWRVDETVAELVAKGKLDPECKAAVRFRRFAPMCAPVLHMLHARFCRSCRKTHR